MNKKRFLVSAIICLPFIIFLNGCYYDNQAELHPRFDDQDSFCDTTGTITYNGKVKDFMIAYCGSQNSCHGSTNDSNWDLSTYAGVSDAADHTLMDAINQTGSASPMPKNAGKLNDKCIEMIQKWINQGKIEN